MSARETLGALLKTPESLKGGARTSYEESVARLLSMVKGPVPKGGAEGGAGPVPEGGAKGKGLRVEK